MKKENKNNYYNNEDMINFEKLKKFKEFKNNKITNNQKSHPQRYTKSDSENFKIIIGANNEISSSEKKEKIEKKEDYYKSLDFENFEKIKKNFFNNNDNGLQKTKDSKETITKYTDNDKNAFDQIIKTNNTINYKEKKSNNQVDKGKIKIIDFDKLKKKEKNLKNKIGIDKIKIVYFD